MKKNFFLFLLFISVSFSISTSAQMTKFTYSENFPELNTGGPFIRILKNSNTVLLHLDKKGFNTKVYGPDKKTLAEEYLPVTLLERNLVEHSIEAIIEVNNDILVFIVGYPKSTDRAPTLYRFIIDGNTGKLKKEEQLMEQEPLPSGAGYAILMGGVDTPTFRIEKDPDSDYYAIVILRTFAKEMKDRIQVIHYDPMHKEVNNTYLKIPEGYNQISYRDLYIKGGEYVLLCTEPYNREIKGRSKILFSKLSSSTKDFITKEYTYPVSFLNAYCSFNVSPLTEIVSAIMRVQIDIEDKKEPDNKYDVFVLPINVQKFEIGASRQLKSEKVEAQYEASRGDKKKIKAYEGMIQDYLLDNAGNQVFITQVTNKISNSQGLNYTQFSEFGITMLNKESKELFGLYIPYTSNFNRPAGSMMYHSYRNGLDYGMTYYTVGPTFPGLVASKEYTYLFLNDTQKNAEAKTSRDATLVYAHRGLNTYYFKINNKTGEFTKGLLFDPPTSTESARVGLFEKGWFNKETNEYATIYLDIDAKGKKHSGVVWFKLD